MGQPVSHCLHGMAHGHVTPLQQLLHDELPRVPVQSLGCVDVSRITQHAQDALTAGTVLYHSPGALLGAFKGAQTVLQQHTQGLLHLGQRGVGVTV